MKKLYHYKIKIYIHLKNGKTVIGKVPLNKSYFYDEIPISKKFIFSGIITIEKLLNEINLDEFNIIHKSFFKKRKYIDCYSCFDERIYEDSIDFFEIEHIYDEIKSISIRKLKTKLSYKEYWELINNSHLQVERIDYDSHKLFCKFK